MNAADLRRNHPDIIADDVSVNIDDGWVPMVDELCSELKGLGFKFNVAQIKEKFGGLRFYTDFAVDVDDSVWEAFRRAVDRVEDKSYCVCEKCGKPGNLRLGGWIRVLCNEHAEGKKATYMLKYKDGHTCDKGWHTCSVCKEKVCSECASACYNCVDAYKHWHCLKKHVEETKHEGLCNDLAYLISLTDKSSVGAPRGFQV